MYGSVSKTVTSHLVPEKLSAAAAKVSWCTIQSKATNTGTIKVFGPNSDSTGGFTLGNAGDSCVIWAPASLHLGIDLNGIWIQPSVDGEGVDVSFVK